METKGKDGPLPLEEIAALFDGKASDVAAAGRASAFGGTGAGRQELSRSGSDMKQEEQKGMEHIEGIDTRTHTLTA